MLDHFPFVFDQRNTADRDEVGKQIHGVEEYRLDLIPPRDADVLFLRVKKPYGKQRVHSRPTRWR